MNKNVEMKGDTGDGKTLEQPVRACGCNEYG